MIQRLQAEHRGNAGGDITLPIYIYVQILMGPRKEGRQLQRGFRTEAAWGGHRALEASETLRVCEG